MKKQKLFLLEENIANFIKIRASVLGISSSALIELLVEKEKMDYEERQERMKSYEGQPVIPIE